MEKIRYEKLMQMDVIREVWPVKESSCFVVKIKHLPQDEIRDKILDVS